MVVPRKIQIGLQKMKKVQSASIRAQTLESQRPITLRNQTPTYTLASAC